MITNDHTSMIGRLNRVSLGQWRRSAIGLLFAAFGLALLLIGTPNASIAQSRFSQDPQTEYGRESPSKTGSGGVQLPDWAQSDDTGTQNDRSSTSEDRFRTKNPNEPTVPVDGGVFWLALAGGGYALRRLYVSD